MPADRVSSRRADAVLMIVIAVEIGLIAWLISVQESAPAGKPVVPKPVHLVSLEAAVEKLASTVATSEPLLAQVRPSLNTGDGADVLRLMSRSLLSTRSKPELFWPIFSAVSNLSSGSNDTHLVTSSALAVGMDTLLDLASAALYFKNKTGTDHKQSKRPQKEPSPNEVILNRLFEHSPLPHINISTMATAIMSRASFSHEGRQRLLVGSRGRGLTDLLQIASRRPIVDSASLDHAVRAIFQLSLIPESRVELVGGGCVKVMVELMNGTSRHTVIDGAVWTLVSLTNDAWRQAEEIVERRGVPILVKLLSHQSDIVATGAAALLNNLALGSEIRSKQIVHDRALYPLLKLIDVSGLTVRPLDTRKFAASALTALTAFSLPRLTLFTMKAVPTIVHAVGSSQQGTEQTNEILTLLVQVLSNMALGVHEHADAVASQGGLAVMAKVIKSTSNAEVAAATIWGMHNVAVGDDNRIAGSVVAGALPAVFQWLPKLPCGGLKPSVSLLRGVVAAPKHHIHFSKEWLDLIDATAERCLESDWVDIALDILRVIAAEEKAKKARDPVARLLEKEAQKNQTLQQTASAAE